MPRPPLAIAGNPVRRPAARRAAIALRTVAAIGGGYGVAAFMGLMLSHCLPWSRAENVMTGLLAGLLVWPAMVMLCFALRSVLHVCMAIACGTVSLATLALLGGWHP